MVRAWRHTHTYNAHIDMRLRLLTLLMMTAALITACAEEMEDPALYTQTIHAVLDDGSLFTRTAVAEGKDGIEGIMWTKDDALGVFTASGSENAKFTTAITSPQGEADFTGSLKDGAAAYAYYPYSSSNTGRTIRGTLPLVQEYSTTAGTLAYDYKIGTPKNGVANQFTFTHLFPLLRFTVNAEGTALQGDKLVSITLTFPDEIIINSGSFTVPVDGGSVTWSEQGTSSNEMTLKWTDKPKLASGKTCFGYLACPIVEGLKDKRIKITVTTENYQAEFSASLKIDAFAANTSYTFPLTLSKWKEKNESGYIEIDKNASAVTPTLTSICFTAANNSGKILAKKLYYDPSKSSGKYGYNGTTVNTTNASETTQTMTVNEEEGIITGCIPYLFDRNLVPTVTLSSDKATLQYRKDGGFVNWDGESPIDFSSGNVIRVVQNGVCRDYVVDITNTGLPVVVINQTGGDTEWSQTGLQTWNKETIFDNIMTDDGFAIYNADGTSGLVDKDGAVVTGAIKAGTRLRGNISQSWPKKPFAVKLDKKHGISITNSDGSKLEIPPHKRWVLLANWKDKSLMRNHISLGIARLFSKNLPDGIPWNVNGMFVEVVYNGVHIGNYYLCEQIKVDENRLNISDPYEVDEQNPFTGNWTDYGYLLECDDYYDETAKFTTNHRIPFMFKDDVDDGNVILNAVKNKVLDIEDKIYKGYKGTSSTGYSEAYKSLDLPSVIDQLLIYEMTMGTECRHPKSVYMYIDHSGNADTNPKYGKLCAGPVWDFDFDTFPTNLGESWVEKSDRSYTKSIMATPSLIKTRPAPATSSEPTNGTDSPFMWWPLLMSDATFTQMAADRWNEMSGILAAYAAEINATRDLISVSWEYNNAMWPACYSEKCDRQYMTSSGFCGDEYLTSFDEVCTAFHNAYMARLSGMNTFVPAKDWPVSAWKNYIK